MIAYAHAHMRHHQESIEHTVQGNSTTLGISVSGFGVDFETRIACFLRSRGWWKGGKAVKDIGAGVTVHAPAI